MPDPSIRSLFSPRPGTTYLDAATYGLPPRPAADAMAAALEAWRTGTGRWVDDWDRPAEAARADFASLIGARAADIAFMPAVSVATGLVAQGLRPGDVAVVADDEFVSDLFPLLVAERRGVTVRQVPFDGLPDAIEAGTTLVVASLVQMQTGRVADLAAVTDRARAVGARVFLDTSHGTPFIPVAERIGSIDYLVCHAYKHLLGARGTAFLYVNPDVRDDIEPIFANWRATTDPFTTFFGGPLRLHPDAARFDISLAWLPWVATRESVRLVAGWARDGALAEPLALAADLARAIGVPPTGSTIVRVPVADTESARAALDAAGIRAAVRGGAIRLSVHLWNDRSDIDRVTEVIRPYVMAVSA